MNNLQHLITCMVTNIYILLLNSVIIVLMDEYQDYWLCCAERQECLTLFINLGKDLLIFILFESREVQHT